MTYAIAKKVATLTKTSDKYISKVRKESKKKDTPFATSAAKYYPALKDLASK